MEAVLGHYDIGCSVWTYKEKDFGLVGAHYAPFKNDLISLWTANRGDEIKNNPKKERKEKT